MDPRAHPMPTTPQRMTLGDMLAMAAEMQSRRGATQFQRPTPTTPPALSAMDFIQHGTGPAYPMSHAMGWPLPGSTPR